MPPWAPRPGAGATSLRGSERPRLSSPRGHTPGLPLPGPASPAPTHTPWPGGPPVEAHLPWALGGRVDTDSVACREGSGAGGSDEDVVMDSRLGGDGSGRRPGQQHPELPGTGPGGAALVPALVSGPRESPGAASRREQPRGWLLLGGAEGRRVGSGAPGSPGRAAVTGSPPLPSVAPTPSPQHGALGPGLPAPGKVAAWGPLPGAHRCAQGPEPQVSMPPTRGCSPPGTEPTSAPPTGDAQAKRVTVPSDRDAGRSVQSAGRQHRAPGITCFPVPGPSG